MIITVEAQLLRDRSVMPCACGEVSPAIGDYILVKTDYGREAAICRTAPASPPAPLKKFLRVMKILDDEDGKRLKRIAADEEADFVKVASIIEKQDMPMKLAKVCYTFDKRRIFIYYTAQSRVDFRSLLKEINDELHAHVQMIQVSPVECAKIIGGLGICGRPFCCTILSKTRSRSRGRYNPNQKAIGPCGKVLCCWQEKENGE